MVMRRHKSSFCGLLVVLTGLFLGATSESAYAGTITLAPDADARILQITDDRRPEFLAVYTVGSNVQRSLIRFDLSGLPSGVNITDATLVLYANIDYGSNGNHVPMEVYRLTRPWVEPEATWTHASDMTLWTSPGADGDFLGTDGLPGGTPYATSTADPVASNEAVTWDVTTLAQGWYEQSYANDGLLLLSYQGNQLHFRGSGYSDASVHPELIVSYSPVTAPEPSGMTLLLLGSIGIVAASRRFGRRVTR